MKARLLLKALWLLTILFFSILLSVLLSERGAITLPLLHSTRNANLEAEELDRNYTFIQTKESGLRDAVLTSPMELLEKEFRLGGNSGKPYAEHLAYALTMRILSFETRLDSRRNFPNVLSSSPRLRRIIEPMHAGLSSEIDLKKLAMENGYSGNYVLKMFREATGHYLHQYLLRLRVEGALKLMTNGSMPLTDEELEQSSNRTELLLREVYKDLSGCWFAHISSKDTDNASLGGDFPSCAFELCLILSTENYRCSVSQQTLTRFLALKMGKGCWPQRSRSPPGHEPVHAAISHAEAGHQRLTHSYAYMTLAKSSGGLSVGRHLLCGRDIRINGGR